MKKEAEIGVDAAINARLLAAIRSQERGMVSPSEHPKKKKNTAKTLTLNF